MTSTDDCDHEAIGNRGICQQVKGLLNGSAYWVYALLETMYERRTNQALSGRLTDYYAGIQGLREEVLGLMPQKYTPFEDWTMLTNTQATRHAVRALVAVSDALKGVDPDDACDLFVAGKQLTLGGDAYGSSVDYIQPTNAKALTSWLMDKANSTIDAGYRHELLSLGDAPLYLGNLWSERC